MSKITILTPIHECQDYCGFWYVIKNWIDAGYVNYSMIPLHKNGRYCVWINKQEQSLVLEPSDIMRQTLHYEYALCCQYRSQWHAHKNILPWTFFPKNINSIRAIEPQEKIYKSIFSGTVRTKNAIKRDIWINSTEIWSHSKARGYNHRNSKYKSLEDYYTEVAKCRFGLAPAGDCEKNARELEYMFLNTIPIYGPGVGTDYYKPLVEGMHFLSAKNPEEMNHKIETLTKEEEIFMRIQIKKYVDEYLTPDALWKNVLETIQKYNIKID